MVSMKLFLAYLTTLLIELFMQHPVVGLF